MFVEWTDAYKIGIPGLDDDHRKLVETVNHFFTQAQCGLDTRALGAILDQLAQQLETHFKHEEILLDRNDYIDRLSHSTKHRDVMLQLQRFTEPYKNGSLLHDQTADKSEFLSHLLINHITEDDLPFKSCLMTLV
jgi:hemerythrin-like metal-binding protein